MAILSKFSSEIAHHEMFKSVKQVPEAITQLAAMSSRLADVVDTGVEKVKDYAATIAEKVQEYCETNSLTTSAAALLNNVVTNILHMIASPAVKTVAISVASILMHMGILGASAINAFSCLVEKVIEGFSKVRSFASSVTGVEGKKKESGFEGVNLPELGLDEMASRAGEVGIHNMAGEAPKPSKELTAEEDCASMIGMLWTGSTVVTGISAKNPRDFSELVSYFKSHIPTATRDGFFVIRFFQAIMKTLIKIMHILSDSLFPQKVKLDEAFKDTDLVKLWVEEVLILTQPSNRDRIMTNPAWSDRVFFAADIGAYLLAKFTSIQTMPATIYAPIKDLALRIFKVRDNCFAGHITPSVYREPFCFWLFGAPGVGKSTVSDFLIADMLAAEAIVWEGERDFVVNSSMTYANRARPGQPVWRFDDMFAVETGNAFQLEAFMGLKTCAPYNPRMARLEDKDMIVNPELIFVGSNLSHVDSVDGITDVAAFHRRREMLVEARIKDGKKMVDFTPEQTARGEQLEFCVYPDPTDNGAPSAGVKNWLSIDQLRQMAKTKFHDWRERQILLANRRYLSNMCKMVNSDQTSLREKLVKESDDQTLQGVLKQIREFAYHQMNGENDKNVAGPSKGVGESVASTAAALLHANAGVSQYDRVRAKISALLERATHDPANLDTLVASVASCSKELTDLTPVGLKPDTPKMIFPWCKGQEGVRCKFKIAAENENVPCLCYALEKSAEQLVTLSVAEQDENRFDTTICAHRKFYELIKHADEKDWVELFAVITHDPETQAFVRGVPKFSGTVEQITSKTKYIDSRWMKGIYVSSVACVAGTGDPARCLYNECENMHRAHLIIKRRCPTLYQSGVRPKLYDCWMARLKLEARSVWYRIKDAYASVVKWCENNLPTPLMNFLKLAGNVLKVFGIVGGVVAAGLGSLCLLGKATKYTTGSDCMNEVYASTVEMVPLLNRAGHQIIASGDATRVARIGSRGFAESSFHNSGLQNIAAMAARIDANTVFISQYRDKELIQLARCLILSGREMLLLKHYVEAFQREEGEGVGYMISTHNLTLPWLPQWNQVSWKPNSGFGTMILPVRVQLRKSILPFFASQAEHAKFGGDGVVIELCIDGCKRHEVKVRRTSVTAAGRRNDHTSAVYVPNAYAYGVHAPGMCGSVLVSQDRIYGFHIAGNPAINSGYAEPVIREDFRPAAILPAVDLVDIENCADFPLLRNLLPMGYVKGEFVHHESGKTRIQPSLLHGKLNGAPKTAPGVLSRLDQRAGGVSPLFLGVAKHGMVCKQFDPVRVAHVQQWFQKREAMLLQPQRNKVGALSFEEAVVGIPGNPYYTSLDMSTSEGFPFTALKPKGATGKDWLIKLEDDGGRMKVKSVHQILLHELEVKYKQRLQRMVPFTVWVDNLKDCRLPVEKCVPGKTRIFSTSPIDFTIAFRQMYQDYVAAMMAGRFQTMCAVGIACDGPEWTKLRTYLDVTPEWKVMGFDYSNFGPGLIEEILKAAFEDMREWYHFHGDTENEYIIRSVMEEEVCCAVHNMHKWLYQVSAGLPSGCPGTAILNSKVNAYYIALAWLEIMYGTIHGDMRGFLDNVRLVTYGDDLIMTVSPLVCNTFNMLTIVACLSKYDIKMSPPDKNAAVDKPWLDWETISFLKRRWVPRSGDTWLAPIDEVSVWECPQWSWSADEKVLSTLVNCDAGCLLAYGHGRRFYAAYVDKLEKALNAQGVYYVARSWECLDSLFFPSHIRVAMETAWHTGPIVYKQVCDFRDQLTVLRQAVDRRFHRAIMSGVGEQGLHNMMSAEVRTADPPMPCVTVDNRTFPPEMFFGEKVLNAKDALRRYEWYCQLPQMASKANPDTNAGMFSVPLRVQGLIETMKTSRYEQYVRTTFRSTYASGFVYYRGSLRVKFINRARGIFKVQHVFDSRPRETDVVVNIGRPIEITEFFQAGYASSVQTCAVNEVVTIEVPYYLPSVMGVVGPGIDDLAFHNRQYMSLGTLVVRVEDMDGPTDVFVSIADDFSLHAFQGFPPMVTLENEPAAPAEFAEYEMMKAGALIDERAVGDDSAGNVCLQVSGETAASCPNIDLKVYQALSGQEAQPIVEFESILNRWVRLATYDWNSTQTRGTLLTTVDLIDVIRNGLTDVSGGLPFKMFQYWAGDIKLRFEINSNAFQAGQLQISLAMLPSMRRTAAMQDNIYSCSQRSHTILSAGGTGEALLCIPYSYPQPYLPLRGKMWGVGKYHKVEIRVLSTLRGPNTSSSCSVSCFMAIENSTFTGMIPVSEVGDSEILPSSIVAAMAGLSMLMPDQNRDKPPYSGPAEVMMPLASQSMCAGVNLVEPVNSLRLDVRGQTPHPITAEMEIDVVKRVWGLVSNFTIYQTTPIGSLLWTREMNMSWLVNKDNYPMVSVGTVDGNDVTMALYAIPPCDVLQCMTGYGRGSWELRLDVVANHYQRCRIQVVVVPGPQVKDIDAAKARASTNAIFTIEGSGQFEFTVPYIAPQPLWPRRFLGGNMAHDFDPLGYVYIYLINRLVNSSSSAKDVDVLVYKRAGSDYQYSCMAQPSIAPGYNRSFILESTGRVRARAGYYPWYVGVWQGWGNSTRAILRYGAGSDHVAQFEGVRAGFLYRLLWPSEKDIPQVQWEVKVGSETQVKKEDLEYCYPYIKDGYTYLVPLKAEDVMKKVRTYYKRKIEDWYDYAGYARNVYDPGNPGLYDAKYGNVTFIALKIE